MDNIRDRGTKKWTSLMLPENVEMLKGAFAEDDRVEKPLIDEQQKLENDMLLQSALHNNLTVAIKYFKDYEFHDIKGKVLFIDAMGRVLCLEDMEINLDDILDIDL